MRRWLLLVPIPLVVIVGFGYWLFAASRPPASAGVSVQPAESTAERVSRRSGRDRRALAAPRQAPAPDAVDRRVRIPENTEEALARMSQELELDRNQLSKTKNILRAFEHAQQMLGRYPEPSRSENRVRLQHQFRLAMHTVLPKEKEPVLDEYLQRPQ
jgi:hypothetical protein